MSDVMPEVSKKRTRGTTQRQTRYDIALRNAYDAGYENGVRAVKRGRGARREAELMAGFEPISEEQELAELARLHKKYRHFNKNSIDKWNPV